MDPYGVYNSRRLESAFKEIRLLHVQNGQKDSDLIVNFEYVLLSHKPEYIALSYCWGTSPKRKTIIVEGKPFPVTYNVEGALRGLRHESGESHLTIWIDSVCINQEDLDERGEQVAMMRDVYQRARKTVVWLGGDVGDAEIVESAMTSILEDMESKLGVSMNDMQPLHKYIRHVVMQCRRFIPDKRHIAFIQSLAGKVSASFYANDWFNRVWVIQEVAMSQSSVVRYGGKEMLWDHVVASTVWLGYIVNVWDWPSSPQKRIIDIVGMYLFTEVGSDLFLMLHTSRAFKAIDRRDKVFGILGLLTKREQERDFSTLIAPDYRKTVQEVYRDATIYCIKTTGKLDILADVDRAYDDNVGFPSWVPRYDLTPRTISFVRMRPKFKASALSFQATRDSPHPDVVRLEGFRSDTVDVIYEPFKLEKLCDQLTKWWRGCTQELARYPSGDDLLTAFRLTLCANSSITQDLASNDPENEYDFASFVHRIQPDIQTASDDENQRYRLLARSVFLKEFQQLPSLLPSGDFEKFYRMFLQACDHRCFFFTKRGYMGLCPSYSKVGDRVCILLGGKTPYIIRRENGFGRFIGECYVHGIMHGEAMETARRHRWPMEIFDLK